MKKIQGYGPPCKGPFIPKLICTDLGIYTREWKPADGEITPCSPFQINDNEWIGVRFDGKVETYKSSQEMEWKYKASIDTIQSVITLDMEPEAKIEVLRSASELMGVDMQNLVTLLENDKREGESLADVFERIKKK